MLLLPETIMPRPGNQGIPPNSGEHSACRHQLSMTEPHHPFSTHLDLVVGEHRQRAILLGLGVNVDKGLQLCTAEQGAVLPQHPVEKLACSGMAKGKD